jgi:hypothetical protein
LEPAQSQGGAAPNHRSPDPLGDTLDNVHDSFDWLSRKADHELEALRRELKEEDAPTWSEELVDGVLEVALTAAGARCGGFIVEKLMSKKSSETLPAEFVKKMFEEGLPAGIEALRVPPALAHKKQVDEFIDAQVRGVDKLYKQNQVDFNNHTRHEIASLEQASQLLDACSDDNMETAAANHVIAARDAWVTYIAQAKFGSMATQEMRDETNARVPGWMPEHEPSLEAATVGEADGVLEIEARLPDIRENRMQGTPKVRLALLNGINEATRSTYQNRPLSSMSIYRQIRCSVEGDMPDFTLNINEHSGNVGWLRYAKAEWLRARAMVGKPSSEPHDDNSLEEQGLVLLLEDLIPDEIRDKIL